MTNSRVRNYVLELIRLNYISSYNFPNSNFKQTLTENLILKYFTSIVLSIDNQENLNMMSILIIEMCFYTQDLKFFDKILIRVLDLHNHFKEFLQESDKYNLICKFQKNTFIYLFNKLSSSFQTQKMQIFNKKMFSITKIDLKDNSLLKILLYFLKTFFINKDFEVFVAKNISYILNNLPSQVVLNFHALKNNNSKKVIENMKSKKINIYEPYLYIKHNKIFEFLIEVLKSDVTNTYIGEEILELFLILTKNIFFFKCIPCEILLKVILDEENLKKYLTNKKFFELLVGIIVISPFNYSSFNANGQLNAKSLVKTSYEFFKKDITKKVLVDIITMHSDKLKDKMLDLSLNSLKEIIKSMKNIVANYKKALNSQLNKKETLIFGNPHFQSNTSNLIHQNIFIGINHSNTSIANINTNQTLNNSNIGANIYGNSIIYFNPKEKIINLKLMTEANMKDDNIATYKDCNNRSQVKFKNCKQCMNKILIILRVYMQSYFQKNMSEYLNEYLKRNNQKTNYPNYIFNNFNSAFAYSFNNTLNSVNFSNPHNLNLLEALLEKNNLKNNDQNINYNNLILNNLANLNYVNLHNQLHQQSNNIINSQNLNFNNNDNLRNCNNIKYNNNSFTEDESIYLSSPPNSLKNHNGANNGFTTNHANFLNSNLSNNLNNIIGISKNFRNFPNNSNICLTNGNPKSSNTNNFFKSHIINKNNIYNNNLNVLERYKTTNNNNFNFDSAIKEQQVSNFNDSEKIKNMSNFYSNYLEALFDLTNLAYFKPSIAISILYTLFSLKEVISKFGDELILKTIFLVLNLGWSQYETEIYKVFNENFNLKFRKFDYEKIRSFETPLKREFINFLSDIVIYNLVDKISNGQNILSTFNSIMKNKTSRESIFLDICRWNVISKSIRDNMKNEYRNKIQENSQVFIGFK